MIHASHQPQARHAIIATGLLAAVLVAIVITPLSDFRPEVPFFLPLHSALEVLSVVVAALIFAVIWTSRHEHLADNLIILATAFLGVALLDFSHAMSVQGMPIMVTPSSPDKGIAFWLAGRMLSAVALLAAVWLRWGARHLRWPAGAQLAGVLAIVAGVHVVILGYPQILPQMFAAGQGLTRFKVVSEYVLIAAYLMVAVRLVWYWRRPREFGASSLFAAACIMAQGEIFFALYTRTSDFYNLVGHLYSVIAYLYLYRAVFIESVQRPYRLLDRSQRRLSATLDAVPDLLFEMDAHGRYLEVHSGLLDHLAAPLPKLLGRTVHDVLPPEDAAVVLSALQEAQTQGLSRGKVIALDILGKGRRWFELSVAPKPVEKGVEPQFVLISRDITDRFENEQALYALSNFDQLTGLPNRTSLLNTLEHIAAGGDPVAIFWVDLDRFKNINDVMGHASGDQLLVETARRLRSKLRSQDVLSRHSGDSFVAVAHGLGRAQAAALAANLLSAVAEPVSLSGHELSVTVSIGVTMCPDDTQDPAVLLKNAEGAMYRVKDEGRNHYEFYASEVQTRVTHAAAVGAALKLAFQRGELRLVYQPQVSLDDGHVTGAEALLRWDSPRFGAVSPAEFIPLAEANGLIVPIGEWVIRQALTQLHDWLAGGLPKMALAINLSATQFMQSGFIEQASRILDATQAPPDCVEFEITEAVAMRAPEAALGIMQRLGERGIHFAIDDFGTGYSSLSYLKRFRINKLKIDQSFVRDIFSDADDQAIVMAVIQMAHSLGVTTIAEGVETVEQIQFLKARGCHEAQGFYFSRPLTAGQFEQYIRNWQPG
ncbi:MAG: EAL domain-containing protein [Castellaniella sp.]|uniref:EAL domain-containing protein n=1 Tax=Castellaniella sp. TaxID=1955812 RepID=UPI00120E74CD|nr:EAL domain-containing protein [Castellaniella sp.]TAN31025.1 MAG: EAL domain-containing protein [Castellaniella sp.]